MTEEAMDNYVQISLGDHNVNSTLKNDHLAKIPDQHLPFSSAFFPVPTALKDSSSFIEDLTERLLTKS